MLGPLIKRAATGVVNLGSDVSEDVLRRIGMGHNRGPSLVDPLDVISERARQVQMPKSKRTQPSGTNPLFELTPEAYRRTSDVLPQRELPSPRVGSPDELKGALARSRQLVDLQDEIAARISEKITPHIGTEAQFFYNMAPVYERLIADGASPEQAQDWLRQFGKAYAGTSPRTNTEDNLRHAFLLLNKQNRGKDFGSIEGVGTAGMSGKPGLSEKGYPMMDFHRELTSDFLNDVDRMDTNPKPTNFAEGAAGNLKSVTADTHAIRGALIALNDIRPGELHRGWFVDDQAYNDYLQDPVGWMSSPDNIAGKLDDSLKSRTRKGNKAQVEYGVIDDLYKAVAGKAGVEPAEAQSLGWFVTGGNTNLASEMRSIPQLLDDRIDVTANAMGVSKDYIWQLLREFRTPLLSAGGAAIGSGLLADGGGAAQAAPAMQDESAAMEAYLRQLNGGN